VSFMQLLGVPKSIFYCVQHKGFGVIIANRRAYEEIKEYPGYVYR